MWGLARLRIVFLMATMVCVGHTAQFPLRTRMHMRAQDMHPHAHTTATHIHTHTFTGDGRGLCTRHTHYWLWCIPSIHNDREKAPKHEMHHPSGAVLSIRGAAT